MLLHPAHEQMKLTAIKEDDIEWLLDLFLKQLLESPCFLVCLETERKQARQLKGKRWGPPGFRCNPTYTGGGRVDLRLWEICSTD